MENQNIAFTLGVGVLVSLALFVLFYKVLKRPGKLASLLTFLVVLAIYVPLAVLYWGGLDVFAIHFAFFTMAAVLPGIIVGNRPGSDTDGGRLHWGPGIIIGFFMILVIVDSTIITLANSGASADFIRNFLPEPRRESAQNVTSAFPGTVSNDYQKKYDLYNNYIGQLKTQQERGWQVADGWLEKPQPNKASMFRIHVTDKAGQAVMSGNVKVSFLRPSNKAMDVTLELPEAAPGFYGQPIALPAPGAWDMVMTVKRGDEVHEVKGETWVGEKP
ncbi:FixH family protein [Thiothrix winogradskyi]|uniref:FixH family protein n=1 Tax=Thiothrix winogradskyi TaxID=96472 RepID=A0ABY3SYM9_9GAMM|nr:FixH family protein [Thiothrix winogradskyi]UJS23739.1 FixH family protein [Thiothrix winogradskyi]